jgi:hypothetical protein
MVLWRKFMTGITSITATDGRRTRHMGSYLHSETAERVIKFIEDFAGIGWQVKDVIKTRQRGIYHARPAKCKTNTPDGD